jgi:hypothetical protein
MFVFETGQLTNPRYIINFPAKATGGARADEDIDAGLVALAEEIACATSRRLNPTPG